MPFQHRQNSAQDADLIAHAPLGQRDDGKVLFARNAGDEPVGVNVPGEGLLNHGAGGLRVVGVADVDGDVLFPHRENGILVKHLRAGIAQLPKLVVGDFRDSLRIVHDPGVGHEDAGHVRPVLVHVRVQRRRRQRAGDIAAAPGEGMDGAVGHGAVESGDHRAVAKQHLIAQRLVGHLPVHGAVHVEHYPVCRVHELEAEVGRHQFGGEILAPADQLLLGHVLRVDALFQSLQLRLQRQVKPQLIPDVQIAGRDHVKNAAAVHAVLDMGIAQIEKVGQLMVIAEPLARGGDHHDPALRVGQKDIPYLAVLAGIRHGAAAEFDYFHFLFLSVTLSHPRIAAANALGFSFSHACIAATDTGAVTAALPQCSFVSPFQLPRTYHVSFSSFTAAAWPP